MSERLKPTDKSTHSELGLLAKFWYLRDLVSLEKTIGSKEVVLDIGKTEFIILIPGMNAGVAQLLPLQRALSDLVDNDAQVVSIPLGRSWAEFGTLVKLVTQPIEDLLNDVDPKQKELEITLLGHSHGGRVASQAVSQLASVYPDVSWKLITAGTPIVKRPSHRILTTFTASVASKSFRYWEEISQPSVPYIALYSETDAVVLSSDALEGSQATQRVMMEGFTHQDFIEPGKILPWIKENVLK